MGMNMQAGSPPPSVGGVPQQGLYNVGMPFESLDQIMSNNLRGLTESSISQFNLPFTFATSNLR